ncbi:class I SAM-dependent methyltransferase [Lutibacter sp. TH_r2]|uniref:SAM-dependent methyltransferase n=1 Tax=Lutibacter sp. TH_r2 TaxID=3082083 RepID=UPI002953FE15|nr:class I SAM-dependent methyltransferase [Lutibacter sp. TH_r2]MDV7187495.1 class I SAM-dependent methyltransferase [Lutibacter sp. TH_r2]
MSKKDWFALWFNTSYYHTLYKHRDFTEAQEFMQHLLSFLNFKKEDLLLDLACGKGRHSIYLNSLGYNVIGADLSPNSIKHAKKFENETLHFLEHDMRIPFKRKYNGILNLFTSFGFFEDDNEDINVLKNIKNALEPNGIAVIDFMNCTNVISNLVPENVQEIDGITFNISRYIEGKFIVKQIEFKADGKEHVYFEKVKNLDLNRIQEYMNLAGLKVKHIFGDYKLNEFKKNSSDRLIIIAE